MNLPVLVKLSRSDNKEKSIAIIQELLWVRWLGHPDLAGREGRYLLGHGLELLPQQHTLKIGNGDKLTDITKGPEKQKTLISQGFSDLMQLFESC